MAKVVLAIDASEHSVRAWDFYKENIRRSGDEVTLVHCLEPPYEGGFPMRAEVLQDHMNEIRKEAEGAEAKFKKLMEENNITYKMVSDFGKPGEFVVKTANDNQATLIVMGTRGMGKIRRTILGSVSDYVVHHAHCPVLIVRH